ncbi:hypothetical protein D4764_07G0007610 [Takifugu flavidus]|uniref:Uncharacterized protein n=1 Tax=Takifugu flavidus TaxID=433684 RepID=A0A5C6MS04_9TELE|nr:hypothetical protein D4764_07G0007610 [Takifugu flavidus]
MQNSLASHPTLELKKSRSQEATLKYQSPCASFHSTSRAEQTEYLSAADTCLTGTAQHACDTNTQTDCWDYSPDADGGLDYLFSAVSPCAKVGDSVPGGLTQLRLGLGLGPASCCPWSPPLKISYRRLPVLLFVAYREKRHCTSPGSRGSDPPTPPP